MDELLDQIEESCRLGHFYLALFCCLALPDICGAISSDDGLAAPKKYKAWFDTYVAPNYRGTFDGDNCYAFRCSALHQGRARHKNLGYTRIIFVIPTGPNSPMMHNNVLNDALNLDTSEFCREIVQAVRTWMSREAANHVFQKNMATLLRRHRGGLPPYILGADVFS